MWIPLYLDCCLIWRPPRPDCSPPISKACSQFILVSLWHALMSPTQPVFTPIHVGVDPLLQFLPQFPSMIIPTNYRGLEDSIPFVISSTLLNQNTFSCHIIHLERCTVALWQFAHLVWATCSMSIPTSKPWLDISISLDLSLLWLSLRDVLSE